MDLNRYRPHPPLPVSGKAENGKGWGLVVFICPVGFTHGYYSASLSGIN